MDEIIRMSFARRVTGRRIQIGALFVAEVSITGRIVETGYNVFAVVICFFLIVNKAVFRNSFEQRI